MTYLELVDKELTIAGKPLTINEILTNAEKDGTLSQIPTIGKTPQKTINALLHRDIAKGSDARFVQTSTRPAKFDLNK